MREGNCVRDVGATVGRYTRKMSELVGPEGRVVALEPARDTFELLEANAARLRNKNVTPAHVAASDECGLRAMSVRSSPPG